MNAFLVCRLSCLSITAIKIIRLFCMNVFLVCRLSCLSITAISIRRLFCMTTYSCMHVFLVCSIMDVLLVRRLSVYVEHCGHSTDV